MTLNEMAEAVHDMLAYSAQQGYDPKKVKVDSISFSYQVPHHEVKIHDDGHFAGANVYFSV